MEFQKEIILKGLPKISLNKWYAGTHWSKRKKLKDTYHLLINSQVKIKFPKTNRYNVVYEFYFKQKPLDASNCVAMLKMIEDVIFEDDNYKIVESITIKSKKAQSDFVKISIQW